MGVCLCGLHGSHFIIYTYILPPLLSIYPCVVKIYWPDFCHIHCLYQLCLYDILEMSFKNFDKKNVSKNVLCLEFSQLAFSVWRMKYFNFRNVNMFQTVIHLKYHFWTGKDSEFSDPYASKRSKVDLQKRAKILCFVSWSTK